MGVIGGGSPGGFFPEKIRKLTLQFVVLLQGLQKQVSHGRAKRMRLSVLIVRDGQLR